MTAEERIAKATKQMNDLLYYFPYMSENILLRDKIIDIYFILKDDHNAKDRNKFIHYPQRQED